MQRAQAQQGSLLQEFDPVTNFPIGLYLAIWWDDANLKALKGAGFNLIGARGEMKSVEDWRKFLDSARRHGLKAWVTLWHKKWWATDLNERAPQEAGTVEERIRLLREFIPALKDHPALLVWDASDEINISDAPVEGLVKGYRLVKRLDPKHPVWANFTGPLHIAKVTPEEITKNLSAYSSIADIVSFDFYPFAYGVQVEPDLMGYSISLLRRAVRKNKPVWAVIQADYQPKEKGARFPTKQELRLMTYDAIINGANGVLYFGQDVTVGWTEEFRKALFQVTSELKTLSPVLLAADDSSIRQVLRWAPVRWRCKMHKGRRYLIVANRWVRPVRVKFVCPKVKKLSSVEALFENRNLQPVANGFEDEMEGYGVRMYRLF